MTSNEGRVDRIIRVVAGVVILALAFTGPHTPLGYLGILPLATGLARFCPLYRLLGVSTCAAAKQ
jgi:hypothetical protein